MKVTLLQNNVLQFENRNKRKRLNMQAHSNTNFGEWRVVNAPPQSENSATFMYIFFLKEEKNLKSYF